MTLPIIYLNVWRTIFLRKLLYVAGILRSLNIVILCAFLLLYQFNQIAEKGILYECWEFNPYYIMYYAISDIVFTVPTLLLLVSTFINRKNQVLNSRYYWVPFIQDVLTWLFVFVNNYNIFSDSLVIVYAYAGSYIATNTDEIEKSSELLMLS